LLFKRQEISNEISSSTLLSEIISFLLPLRDCHFCDQGAKNMMPFDPFSAPRLFIHQAFEEGAALSLEVHQSHYLLHVMRLEKGDPVLVFNGRDGEWRATITGDKRKKPLLQLVEKVREQTQNSDLVYCFAPLKHARLDYMIQKATEMGAGILQPVITRRTQIARLNEDRMRANAIEASEQCGLLNIPQIKPDMPFHLWLEKLDHKTVLIFCDEDAEQASALTSLSSLKDYPVSVLIGPEGGFTDEERKELLTRDNVIRLSLGPRILRADTAAVAALALVQAIRER
jgi:16S rRNA (uracil1498-N3)-methyltransferase